MAKGKKPQPVEMKQPDTRKLVVKPGKESIGHQLPCCGTGIHQDKRTKRKNTRKAANDAAIKDHV